MRKDEKTPEWLNTNACLQNLNTFLEPASTLICVYYFINGSLVFTCVCICTKFICSCIIVLTNLAVVFPLRLL